MSNNAFSQDEIAQFHNNYTKANNKQPKQQAPSGIKGVLTNLLPAIGGGLGAVAGIPLDFLGGAGSIAGGAAGASLGEALKEKLLGQQISAKQVGIQGLEGGALSAFNPLKALGAASNATKGFVTAGADTAKQATLNDALAGVDRGANKFANDLVTQGQSAQGRVAGVSPGTKIGATELTPQDQTRMLNTLKTHGINTNNANLGLRDVQNKLDAYGKQISDHFTANNAPLNPVDTKTLAANYLTGLKTTDPGVLKQANVLANDLEKNVKDTKSLWEFRKTLDDKIPDNKQGSTLAVTNKIEAVKGMRQYIAGQLGDIPGAQQYHDLSDLKPFVSAEAKRLNNPGGGIVGRLLSSGPVQAAESTVGKGVEAIGNKLGGKGSMSLDDALNQTANNNTLDAGVVGNAQAAPQNLDQVLASKGIPVKYTESTTKAGVGALLPTGAQAPVEPLSNIAFAREYKPIASQLTKQLPNIYKTASGAVKDPLNVIVNHLAGAANKSETSTVVGKMFPELDNATKNKFVRALQATNNPTDVKQLLSDASGLDRGQEGVIKPAGYKANFNNAGTSQSQGIINTPNTYRTEIPQDVLQQASDAAGQIGNEAPTSLPAKSLASQITTALKGTATLPVRAAAAPLAYPGRSIAQVGKQEVGRLIGDAGAAGGAAQPQPQSATDLAGALAQTSQQPDQSQQTSQSPYSMEALQYDVERDPANATKYISYYESLDKIYNPTGASSVSKPTAQQNGLAQSGYGSLQQLASLIQTNPDIITKNATPGQGIPLIGSLISNASGASNYHALSDNVLQALIHLQTGATATPSEVTAAHGQLPQPGDSAAVRQQKLQTLLGDFSPFLGAAQ